MNFLFLFTFLSLFIPLLAQEKKFQVGIGTYKSDTSTSHKELEEAIAQSIKEELSKRNIQASFEPQLSVENLSQKDEQKFGFLIIGFYFKSQNSLTIYNLIYDPQKRKVIDALRTTNDLKESLGEDILKQAEKYRTPESKLIRKNAEQVASLIQSNLNAYENQESLYAHWLSYPISKKYNFNLETPDIAQTSRDFLRSLETEVVSAARKVQKISEAPSKIYVFTQETIQERGYRTLTELLQDVPGFDFNSFYDSGEYPTDLILRGISDVGQSQILIMENGIIQNDIRNGWLRHMQFDTLFIDVERIEIILGPGSSLYGANAYAGLINIITKKGKSLFENKESKTWVGSFRTQAGKYKTSLSEGSIAYKFENNSIFQISGRYYHTEGDRGKNRPDPGDYFHNNFEPYVVRTTEFGRVQNDTFSGFTKPITDGFNNSAKIFFIRGNFSKEGFNFGFNLWDLNEGLGSYVPGYEYFANTKEIPYKKHHRGFYVHADYETELTRNVSSQTKIYYRNTTIMPDTGFVYTYRYQSISFPTLNQSLLPPVWDKAKQYHGPSFVLGGLQQFNFQATETNHFILGFQVERFIRQSISDSVGGVSLGKKQSVKNNIVESAWENEKRNVATIFYSSTISVYIQDEQKLWNDKISLTLGVRFDQDSDYGKIFTKRFGFIFKPFDFYNTKLLYGEAFKAPTVFQLYDEFRGNKELVPQKIHTYEWENTFIPKKDMKLQAGYFFSQLKDLIAEGKNPDPNAPATRTTYFQNFKPTHIYGFLVELDIKILNGLNFFGNYTITRDRDVKTKFTFDSDQTGNITTIQPIYDGKEIDNIAERKANLGLNWKFWKDMNFNLRMNWVGKRKAPNSNRYFQPTDFEFIRKYYPYMQEGKPDGYLASYTLLHATFT